MFPSTHLHRPDRGRIAGIVLFILLPALFGCSKPLLEGPQITKLPLGFMMDANASASGSLFSDREEASEFGYFCLSQDDEHSSIMITTYAGTIDYEQVQAAYAEEEKRRSYKKFEPIQTMTIDDRTAWGWITTQEVKGRLASRELVVVIPFDTDETVYVVEFYSSQEKFWDEALMKETLASFRVKKAGVSYGKLGAFLFLAAGFVGFMVKMKKDRPV